MKQIKWQLVALSSYFVHLLNLIFICLWGVAHDFRAHLREWCAPNAKLLYQLRFVFQFIQQISLLSHWLLIKFYFLFFFLSGWFYRKVKLSCLVENKKHTHKINFFVNEGWGTNDISSFGLLCTLSSLLSSFHSFLLPASSCHLRNSSLSLCAYIFLWKDFKHFPISNCYKFLTHLSFMGS